MSKQSHGNGDGCPVDPGHGRMYVLPSGHQYCPTQVHDRDRTPNLYERDGRTPVRRTP